MSRLPSPPVPAECAIQNMPGMVVDLTRLFNSEFFLRADAEEFRAAFCLWGCAFQQKPAGSLPNDDVLLAKLSRAGRKWSRVRAMALHGFVLCSDGRLYHPVVAEKAFAVWQHRNAQRAKAGKRWSGRELGDNPEISATYVGDISEIKGTYLGDNSEIAASKVGDNSAPDSPNPLKSQERRDAAAFSPAMPIKERNIKEGNYPSLREGERAATAAPAEKAQADLIPAEGPTKGKKSRAKPRTQIPFDWKPGAEEREFAVSHNVDPDKLTPEFIAYWRREGKLMADWPWAFRHRVLKITRVPYLHAQYALTPIHVPPGQGKPSKLAWMLQPGAALDDGNEEAFQ